jgi:hypothetical protein
MAIMLMAYATARGALPEIEPWCQYSILRKSVMGHCRGTMAFPGLRSAEWTPGYLGS